MGSGLMGREFCWGCYISKDKRREEDKGKRMVEIKPGGRDISNTGRKFEMGRGIRDGRSYKDVVNSECNLEGVKKNAHVEKNIWEMHIPSDNSEWVKRSLTGIMKPSFDLVSLKKALEMEGWKFRLRYGEESVTRSDQSLAKVLLRVESPYDVPETVTIEEGEEDGGENLKKCNSGYVLSREGVERCHSLEADGDEFSDDDGSHVGLGLRGLNDHVDFVQSEDNEVVGSPIKKLIPNGHAYNIKWVGKRQLLDCAFMANESIDFWRKKERKGVVFNIDFRKAYDSVEWPIILRLLKIMGFGEKWISWIRYCISSASILVLVNGSLTTEFHMGKGLRQGCSLSPLLFNIVGELLNLMLCKAVNLGFFEGFSIGKEDNPFNLTHLQFADGFILFYRDSSTQILNIRRVLRVFSLISGLHLNLSKSKLFGVNLEEDIVKNWASEAGCGVSYFPMTYLGLPIGAIKNSEVLWESVLQKVYSRLAGWKVSSLSMAERVVLVKLVLSSLPILYLSIFKLPLKVNQKLNSIMARFLWGEEQAKKRIHWINWNMVCQPYDKGGLGILDVRLVNRVLLGKWVWKYANEKEAQWKKLLYCKLNVSNLSLSICNVVSPIDSWIWRGILNNYEKEDQIGECLRSNSKIQVGNDKSIEFWNNVWVNGSSLKSQFPRIFALSNNKKGKVTDFGCFENNGWWMSLMLLIDNIRMSESVDDFLGWSGNGDVLFSVKSCRMTLSSRNGDAFQWKKWVWSGLVPPRVETFLWHISHRKVAIHKVWDISTVLPQDPASLLCSWSYIREYSTIWKFIPGVVFWSLWKARNSVVDLLIGDPSLANIIYTKLSKKKKVICWSPPPHDFFKFNVDGR
ncbi:uncharacterized protein LOC120140301 [Hibiscus syriacus]|uniref:uncharacterized protein LOC120140301 n=1 Tax=Hibiscus syriacus TaxID=106335 RepID=UPI0019244368|nr:uncharacterized protein LOC120140301 [Hibiscus syriacus]